MLTAGRFDQLYQLVDELIFQIVGCFLLLAFSQLLLQILFIISQGVKLADILYELIVYLGQFLHFNFMQLALEGSCLALQLLRLVILREGDVYFELVAGIMAHDLLLKAGDKLSAAQGQAVIFALAALERLTI